MKIEKIKRQINGVAQGMIIRSENKNNPVILFLHGGPGRPKYFLASRYLTSLEKYFTICYWEQRGVGLSYTASKQPIKMEQLISDTIEVTHYLQKRYKQEKIYLMGHSWGTFLGIQVAAKSPEQYEAYIGVAQVSYQKQSEELAYTYILEKYKNKPKMLKKLKTNYNEALRDRAMHELGIGTMHGMYSVIKGIFMPLMFCKAYTLQEKLNIWRGKVLLNQTSQLGALMRTTDLRQTITQLKLPIYFMSGIYDYTVNYGMAKAYLRQLRAPIKGFYTFKQSAHSPLYEEPKHFMEIMLKDVLHKKNDLAE